MKRNLDRIQHKSNTASLTPQLPIMAYPVPANPASPPRRRHRRPVDKHQFNGLKLVISREYQEALRACAECMGITPRQLLYTAVGKCVEEVTRVFLPDNPFGSLSYLNRQQRAKLALMFRSVNYPNMHRLWS
jgi:hypothetical protein